MVELQGFLGQHLQVPADRWYDGGRNLWLLVEEEAGEQRVQIGVSGPGLALTGGLIELEVFPQAGEDLVLDQEVAFATTKKNMKYFLSPVAGRVVGHNPEAGAAAVNGDPYSTWFIKVVPVSGWEEKLLDAAGYVAMLLSSEHATPEAAQAAKGGKASPTCKSVYGGIKEG